jgi:CheY-like chemotaxis protein
MDGYELAARLRDIPSLRSMMLVAMTGYGQESDRRKTRTRDFITIS